MILCVLLALAARAEELPAPQPQPQQSPEPASPSKTAPQPSPSKQFTAETFRVLAHAEIDRIFDNAMGVDDLPGALSQVAGVLSSYESQIAEDSNFQVPWQEMPMVYAGYRFRAPQNWFRAPQNWFRAPQNVRKVRDPRNGRPIVEELRAPVYAATFRPPRNAHRWFRAPINAQEGEAYDANGYVSREPLEEENELRAPIVYATWYRPPMNRWFRDPMEEEDENGYEFVRAPAYGATWFRPPKNGKFRAPREAQEAENAAVSRPPLEESNRIRPPTA